MAQFSPGAERGAIRKKWKGRLAIALLYPNLYPIAASNLGFQLVYAALNGEEDLVCERFVYPAPGQPFRSLESSRLLHDFPLVFASISFERDYPRLAAMLAAGGIEPFAVDRAARIGPGQPLVVFGGVAVMMNPEPLARFADLIAIGEAEALLPPLMRLLRNYSDIDRNTLLEEAASSLAGCYIPSLYSFTYGEAGTIDSIQSHPKAPGRVRKQIAARMETAGHSILSTPAAELDMHMVELGRGCSQGCRFCAAGYIHRPPRLWSTDAVRRGLAQKDPARQRIGLLGMEMISDAALDAIVNDLPKEGCVLSFSSLRADRISGAILDALAQSPLKSAAIAADGASERLRRMINKCITQADLLSAAVSLTQADIFQLKLYVMIGLPSETEADLEEFVALVKAMQRAMLPVGRARGRVSTLTVSTNCFIPKPWTALQYCGFGGATPENALEATREPGAVIQLFKQKIAFLRRALAGQSNLRLSFDAPEHALEQACYAKADRRIAPVLAQVGGGRSSFKQAMQAQGLNPSDIALRPRAEDEMLCWELIDHGLARGYLWREYQRALAGIASAPCPPAGCQRCGVCDANA